jgi:hypothetical protein
MQAMSLAYHIFENFSFGSHWVPEICDENWVRFVISTFFQPQMSADKRGFLEQKKMKITKTG